MFGLGKSHKEGGKPLLGTKKCGMFFKDGVYTFTYNGHICRTPKGTPAETENEILATRIFEHIKVYGDEMTGVSNILSWHYTYQCNFRPLGQRAVVEILKDCFLGDKRDITYLIADKISYLGKIFGEKTERQALIEKWLEGCSVRQLTAACCIGNGYRSLNVAYIFQMISFSEDIGSDEKVKDSLINVLSQVMSILPTDIESDIELFKFYYGLDDPDAPSVQDDDEQKPWKDASGRYRCAGDDCPVGLCGSGKCPLDLYTIAIQNLKNGDFAGAIKWIDKALKIAPDFAEGWANRGVAYGNMGNHQEAYTSAMKALEINPDYQFAKDIVASATKNLRK